MSDVNTLVGRGSHFEGKMTFEGVVRIDGSFEGEIVSSDTLIIGEGALELRCPLSSQCARGRLLLGSPHA